MHGQDEWLVGTRVLARTRESSTARPTRVAVCAWREQPHLKTRHHVGRGLPHPHLRPVGVSR